MHAIVSQKVVTPDGVRPAAVLVDGERIAEVRDEAPAGVPREDLGALVLSPGLVDGHVHVNEPGRTEWEGFVTATRAAASGGVTTLVDMPLNCDPVTTSREALEVKVASTDGELHVDVGFWGGVVPGNAEALRDLARGGVLGAKAFLCHSGLDDFPASDEATLRAAMGVLAEAGLPLLAHAELELDEPSASTDPRRYEAWLSSRPARWEEAAIERLITLCRETGCAVHVVHLSAASALPAIAAAKAEGLPLTVETCPHYLCLRAEDVPDGATAYKCAPPIRDDANREGLWRGLLDGVIDFVVTDHSPCTPHLKHLERGDFLEAWGGIASLSLGLPSVWTEASARGADPATLARWMSEGPARFAGLAADKGAIAPGRHADLVAWDPEAETTVRRESLLFRHPVSPYLGRTLRGVVRGTWLRGRRIYDGERVDGPHGRTLRYRGDAS
ncbi:MAG TPA: allantoinase AllB [Sandaracinaceae bacterium LLY-WYZ-13_1]|nr:allantoinase AllB [Sandaracinaceae bacterium LLY-WYZ-13_1]